MPRMPKRTLRRSTLKAIMRAIVALAWQIRRLFLGLFRMQTSGVKVMVFNRDGDLLLIRNSYGDLRQFLLPGGGIGLRESPASAAEREVREEVGLAIRGLEPVATYISTGEGKRDTIHLFRAEADGKLSPDPREINEARFFSLDDLPSATSPATRRRIAELASGAKCDDVW